MWRLILNNVLTYTEAINVNYETLVDGNAMLDYKIEYEKNEIEKAKR